MQQNIVLSEEESLLQFATVIAETGLIQDQTNLIDGWYKTDTVVNVNVINDPKVLIDFGMTRTFRTVYIQSSAVNDDSAGRLGNT